MKRLLFVIIALSCVCLVSAQEGEQPDGKPASVPALNARIVQLEEQLRQTQFAAQVCGAQLAVANQPKQAEDAQKRLAEAAKAMGCTNGADWNANPPTCLDEKAEKPAAAKPAARVTRKP